MSTSKMPPDHNDPRLGVPPEKLGLFAQPIVQPGEKPGDIRQAVVLIIIPPVELRDAPRAVVEHFIDARKKGILASIVDEIYKAYTSDPLDGVAARVLGERFTAHADALKEKPRARHRTCRTPYPGGTCGCGCGCDPNPGRPEDGTCDCTECCTPRGRAR